MTKTKDLFFTLYRTNMLSVDIDKKDKLLKTSNK